MSGFIEITSRENPLIKQIISLQKSSKARHESGLFILEGLRICSDAFENNIKFDALVVSKTAAKRHEKSINEFSKISKECILIPDGLFSKISDTTAPQGIIALAKMPTNTIKLDKNSRYIALENIADPSNLGAIARTAEALGVTGMVVSNNGCDPYSPKVLRASMGTVLRLPIIFTDNICALAKGAGLRTIACVVDEGAVSISDISFLDGDILLIGNEANGLCDETKENSDILATIRMRGSAESLNAAAAAAIAMWEMMGK